MAQLDQNSFDGQNRGSTILTPCHCVSEPEEPEEFCWGTFATGLCAPALSTLRHGSSRRICAQARANLRTFRGNCLKRPKHKCRTSFALQIVLKGDNSLNSMCIVLHCTSTSREFGSLVKCLICWSFKLEVRKSRNHICVCSEISKEMPELQKTCFGFCCNANFRERTCFRNHRQGVPEEHRWVCI